jgi:RimJ/RimL family protein N-acetyltransferase
MLPFSANNLYFREWEDSDLGDMVRLFDTEEMNRWTPLPSPFTAEVASEYVARAKDAKLRNGTLHLAVCAAAGGPPLGEVILFPSEHPDTVEVAYAVGVAHRGEHIGARAVAAVLDLARMVGARRAILTIASDNAASQGTASAARFARTDTPLRRRERKGFVLQMETWERRL